MAEWLRTGLQIRLRRFDSGSGLHPPHRKSQPRSLGEEGGALALYLPFCAARWLMLRAAWSGPQRIGVLVGAAAIATGRWFMAADLLGRAA